MWWASLTPILLPFLAVQPLCITIWQHGALGCMGWSEGRPPLLQIGAAAFMGGATRMTLTTTVMVMETTGALQLIVPLMITVFVAKVLLRCASTVSFNNRTVFNMLCG